MDKKRAILYTRVSTEEQEQGASLRYQEEQLRQYCEKKDWEVVACYTDNESGRTFDRKSYVALLDYIKKNKSKVDYILVTRSDRFARNLPLMLVAKSEFKKLGISLKAIEQDFDESIPEYKLLENLQYTMDEIESDKISIRVKASNYKFAKEGAFLNRVPKGYEREVINGRASMKPNNFADTIQTAFQLFSEGIYSTEAVRKKLELKTVCKQGFINILRNKVYAGYVKVPTFKGQPAYWTKGLHDPIISNALYEKVQSILNGKRSTPIKASTKENQFFLRGHIICPVCHHPYTASKSKGRKQHYAYYHCDSKYSCNQRYKREEIEKVMIDLLSQFEVKKSVEKVYHNILTTVIGDNTKYATRRINSLQADLDALNEKICKNQDYLLEGKIDHVAFNTINTRLIQEQQALEEEIKQAKAKPDGETLTKFDKGATFVKSLRKLMLSANNEDKSVVIGSIFPENLIFHKGEYRTAKINSFVLLICPNIKGLGLIEKEKAVISDGLTSFAPPLGLEPMTP
jgi:DNA invertase Pin-like site-specific DNA recombinase